MSFMYNASEDDMLKAACDSAAKRYTYEKFCEFMNYVKRNINEFMVASNEKIAKFQSSKVTKQQKIFTEIEKLYIDNKIYFDEVSSTLKTQYVSKNIDEENLDNFKKMKSELNRSLKEYKEVLDGMEHGIMGLDKNILNKVEQEKTRREQERLEAEKRRRDYDERKKDDGDDDYHSSRSNDDDSSGLFGWGIGPF